MFDTLLDPGNDFDFRTIALPGGATLERTVSGPTLAGTTEMMLSEENVKAAIAFWLSTCVFQDNVQVHSVANVVGNDGNAYVVNFSIVAQELSSQEEPTL